MTGHKFSLSLIIAALLLASSSHGLRILGIFPFHLHGHFVMCGELMRGLAEKGHQVDVYSHFPLKEPIPNYRDFSLKGSLPEISNNMSFEVTQGSSVEELYKYWIDFYQKPVCELMDLPVFQKLLHDPPKDPAYDLIITEFSTIYCYVPFGRLLNVPVIGVVTPPLSDWQFDGFGTPINLAVDPSNSGSAVAPMSFWERVNNVLVYTRSNRCFRKYSAPQNEYVEKYFGPGLPNIIDLAKEVSLVLANYDQASLGIRTFSPKVIPVGGLHVVDHNETLPPVVQKWLDESENGCVYFTFGSMARIETFPKHMIEAFYAAFKNIAPVRVLMKIAKPEELPPGLPSNVLTRTWMNQIQVLKHKNIKAFVTHGGLMGTQEAIYYGVPLVGIPLLGDQHFNVPAYVQRKIAIKVDLHEINEETFTRALKEVLYNPVYRNSMKKMSERFKDRPLTPLQTAVFWVEYIHRHGKDALKSPLEDMTWWQATLLDVYAFFAALIIIPLCLIIVIVKKLFSAFFIYFRIKTSPKLKKR